MTGDELRAIRHELGLSQKAFGKLLGFQGRPNNIRKEIDRMEMGIREIREETAEIARRFKINA